jgi:membrane fusion protein, multidrug efflux system
MRVIILEGVMQGFYFTRRLQLFIAIFMGLTLIMLLSVYTTAGLGQENAASAPPPPEVDIQTIKQEDVPLEMSFMGQTAGSKAVEVRARVGGILLHRNYEEGSRVHQGDLMFEIDPAPYQAALEQARGALGQAEANLAQAKRNAVRMEKLFSNDVVAKNDYDVAKTTLDADTAAVETARGKVREASLNLEWTKVTAPVSGMTSKETRSEGSLISTTSDASLLTVINRIDPLYVNFSMSSPEMLKLQTMRADGRIAMEKGNDFVVRMTLPDGNDYAQRGYINFTDTQVESTTGVVKVRAQFPNDNSAVLPGQFVRVHLDGAHYKNVVAIPQGAVLNTQQGAMVWTLNDQNQIAERPVVVGDSVGTNFLIEKGLEPGDRIVVTGITKVRPGMTVQIHQEGTKLANEPLVPNASEKVEQSASGERHS